MIKKITRRGLVAALGLVVVAASTLMVCASTMSASYAAKCTGLEKGKAYNVEVKLVDSGTGLVATNGDEVLSKRIYFTAKSKTARVQASFGIDDEVNAGKTLLIIARLYEGSKVKSVLSDGSRPEDKIVIPSEPKASNDKAKGEKNKDSGKGGSKGKSNKKGESDKSGSNSKGSKGGSTSKGGKSGSGSKDDKNASSTKGSRNGSAVKKGNGISANGKTSSQNGIGSGTSAQASNGDHTGNYQDAWNQASQSGPRKIIIKSEAIDKSTGTRECKARCNSAIIDNLTLANLTVGEKYTVKSKLICKDTGKLVSKDAKAKKTFTVRSSHGRLRMAIVFDASKMENREVQVVSEIYHNGTKVADTSRINGRLRTVGIIAFDKGIEGVKRAKFHVETMLLRIVCELSRS